MGVPLERVRGTIGTTPHQRLATSLGLYQLLYAFSYFISFKSTHLDVFGPSGDFLVEIRSDLGYFASRFTGRRAPTRTQPNFGQAFGVEGYSSVLAPRTSHDDDVGMVLDKGSPEVA